MKVVRNGRRKELGLDAQLERCDLQCEFTHDSLEWNAVCLRMFECEKLRHRCVKSILLSSRIESEQVLSVFNDCSFVKSRSKNVIY